MKIAALALIISSQFASVANCQDKPEPTVSQAAPMSENASKGQAPADYDYAWDQFNHRGKLIWDCRGVQSGAFVAAEFCALKEKVDTHWPDKNIPGHWKPQ
jgi:hypothetical protein